MLSNIEAKYQAITLGLKVSDVGEIKEKYKRDPKTVIEKGNLDIAITNWLNLKYDYKEYGRPSWRLLAHVMYNGIDNSEEVRRVYRKIVKEHPKKK